MWSTAFTLTVLLLQANTAQNHPNFSGTWKMDVARSESAHQSVPIGPVWLVIQQTGAELTIETKSTDARSSAVNSETLTYQLDGTESKNNGKTGLSIKVKAHWDGEKIVTETEREVNDSTITTMQIFHLSADGKEITIDKTLNVQHGYQSAAMPKVTGRGKDVFVKTAAKK